MVEWVTSNGDGIIQILLQVIGIFSIAAAWTPNSADNKIANALLELVNFMGFNLNKAKNDPAA